jgi:hypothetical protein
MLQVYLLFIVPVFGLAGAVILALGISKLVRKHTRRENKPALQSKAA